MSGAESLILGADDPSVFLGQDIGPNPVEQLLTALANCLTTALAQHTAGKGIQLQEVESRVEGDIDLPGFLRIDENVRAACQNIRMNFKIKADATKEQIEEQSRVPRCLQALAH